MDNVLSEIGYNLPSGTKYNQINYSYDTNGRRTQVQGTLGSTTFPAVNYGYDCADELVSMSNKGTSLQSCDATTSVSNGNTSTQVGFNYDPDGNLNYRWVDGVQSLFTRDSDERVTEIDFQPSPTPTSTPTMYGNVTYGYDADGRLISKGGSLGQVNFPANETANFNILDQISSWNGITVQQQNNGNITYHPSNGFTYTWNKRNQLTAITGNGESNDSETYDPLGRRLYSVRGSHSLSFLNDGSDTVGSIDSGGDTWNLLPGGLEGFKGAPGNATATVPLLDGECSNVGQVPPGQPPGTPPTTYTYDDLGNTTVNGQTTTFPEQWHSNWHGVTEPGQLEFINGTHIYNSQNQAQLSQQGQQGLGGPNGGPSTQRFNLLPSQGGSSISPQEGSLVAGYGATNLVVIGEFTPAPYIGAAIAAGFELADFFSGLFGGSSPPTPRELLHGRHPAYPGLDGIDPDLTTDMQPVLDPDNVPPLQKSTTAPSSSTPADELGHIPFLNRPGWGYKYCGYENFPGDPTDATDRACATHDACYDKCGGGFWKRR